MKYMIASDIHGSAWFCEKMLEAFEKGYKQATKSWGKELPDISQQTYDAVHKKFEEYQNSLKTEE